jgi:hypothetical protein
MLLWQQPGQPVQHGRSVLVLVQMLVQLLAHEQAQLLPCASLKQKGSAAHCKWPVKPEMQMSYQLPICVAGSAASLCCKHILQLPTNSSSTVV